MTEKMKKSFAGTTLVLAASALVLAGCGGNEGGEDANGEKKLTYFAALTAAHAGATVDNLADTPLYQKMEEITGVDVEFIHPVSGQVQEQLNLLIASQSLPDIVEYSWNKYPGGAQKAIDDKVIIPIDEYMDNEAKDLKALLENDTKYGYDKMVKTQNGQYYIFPFLRGDEKLATFQGPVVRTDWLEKAGLDTPQTISDWDEMLAAFKQRGNDIIPLSFQWAHVSSSKTFLGTFGVIKDFYLEGDEVVYGPIQLGYKEFLAKMREWYEKGYIDKDFTTQTTDNLEAKIMSGKVGASILMAGSQVGKVTKYANENDLGSFRFEGVPYPAKDGEEQARFGHRDNMFNGFGAAISAACKNPALAASWLNYGYTDEGHLLYNFGIEGESYTMVDGEPIYTDYVLNNPDGLSFGAAGGRYMRSVGDGPFVQDMGYFFQYCSLPEQTEAITEWCKADNTGILPLLSTSEEDAKTLASILNDVGTAVDEFSLQVILGQKSIDSFDEYVAECKRMGIDEAIKIKKAAYENYMSR